MHPEHYTDLDNFDTVENNLRNSAKGSDDACDVTFSLAGGKGEHEGKGGVGSKGRQQVENSVMDEDQENTGTMRSEEEEENHREDVRKLVEMMQKEEVEKGRGGGR